MVARPQRYINTNARRRTQCYRAKDGVLRRDQRVHQFEQYDRHTPPFLRLYRRRGQRAGCEALAAPAQVAPLLFGRPARSWDASWRVIAALSKLPCAGEDRSSLFHPSYRQCAALPGPGDDGPGLGTGRARHWLARSPGRRASEADGVAVMVLSGGGRDVCARGGSGVASVTCAAAALWFLLGAGCWVLCNPSGLHGAEDDAMDAAGRALVDRRGSSAGRARLDAESPPGRLHVADSRRRRRCSCQASARQRGRGGGGGCAGRGSIGRQSEAVKLRGRGRW